MTFLFILDLSRRIFMLQWFPPRITLCILLLGLAAATVWADDWPQWLGPQRDGVWRETGILEKFPAGGPKVRWRTPIGGGYAGPAVAGGKVYVLDRQLGQGVKNPDNPFARGKIVGTERVLCLNEADGKIVWRHEYECPYTISYPAGPRTTPLIRDGKVYTLGAMGDLFCLDALTGKVVWSQHFTREPYKQAAPMWGWSGHPLLDGEKLICQVGGQGTAVVAFHKDTGKELWRALSTQTEHGPGYSPPMIYEAGGKRQLIIWHPEAVCALDPETGKEYWSHQFVLRAGMSIATPRKSGDLLFVSSFYSGPLMVKLANDKPDATVLWKGKSNNEQPKLTDGLHAVMCTPVIRDGYIYGVCSYGQLRCLKAETGERVWESLKATGATGGPNDRWANAFLIAQGDRFFLANEKGDLIIARLSPKGYEEIDRVHLLEPTGPAMGRDVVWSHPAFANRCLYARNDKEIICVSLAAQ
jgi:outer membrane protein assembly factor BamB